MATLSIGTILSKTKVSADSGRRLNVSEGGLIRGRNTFEEPVYDIHFVIQTDAAGKANLDTFYGTYSAAWNASTIDDMSYTWLFKTMPMVTGKDGNIRYVEFDAMGYEA